MGKRYIHMTLFWGRKTEVMFREWPGANGGMYALALIVVFLMALLVELLSSRRLASIGRRRGRVQGGLFLTAVHALQVGLGYMLMLALMSFNIGVLLVAIAGNAVGFLLFRSSVCSSKDLAADGHVDEASPMKC